MKTGIKILTLLLTVLVLTSCSDEKKLAKNLEGLWDISVYQKSVFMNGNVPDLDNSDSKENAGTIEFLENGKGKYNVLYDLGAGTFFDNGDFTWTNGASEVTLKYGSITETFEVIKNSKDKMELIHMDSDFYFEDSEPGVIYSMEESLVLEK